MPPVRPVDAAMRSVRHEKTTMRALWVDKARAYGEKFPDLNDLLYLTLSGAEGHDISALGASGVIELTENGGVASSSVRRVAAVEFDVDAVVSLQRKFPGLKIYERPFQNLVRGMSMTRYPDAQDRDFCRARIVNLDLNQILSVAIEDQQIVFPVLMWIKKLGEMHAVAPRRDWCLCLTLHGEINWAPEVSTSIKHFLAENFRRSPQFSESAKRVLGEAMFNAVMGNAAVDFAAQDRTMQQKTLMVFVPKKIAQLTHGQGWKLTTTTNLRYGRRTHAPIVSWIIDFEYDARSNSQPDGLYLDSLNAILTSAGQINGRGRVIAD